MTYVNQYGEEQRPWKSDHPVNARDASGRPRIFMASDTGIPPMPYVRPRRSATIDLTYNQFREEQMTTDFTNHEARALAAEALSDKKTESIRSKVLTAVDQLQEQFRDVGDGTVFSFCKVHGETPYHYAAIKSNGRWYSTGSKTALAGGDDDELITWLIGLEIYSDEDFVAFAAAKDIVAIEATVTDG